MYPVMALLLRLLFAWIYVAWKYNVLQQIFLMIVNKIRLRHVHINYVTLFKFFIGYGRQEYEEISHPVPQNSDFEGV